MLNINLRRTISLIFIIAFLISAPLLILYTSGYRYSWKKQKISKAGSLILETTPSYANVYLNNESLNLKTPLRLNDLFPNEYQVTIKKGGYYSWEKKLPVYSQQTTFAEDIILFKDTEPEQILAHQLKVIQLLPDKKNLFFITDDPSQETPDPLTQKLLSLKLVPESKYLNDIDQQHQQTKIQLLNLKNQNLKTLFAYETSQYQFQKISWSKDYNFLLINLTDIDENQYYFLVKIDSPVPIIIDLQKHFSNLNNLILKWSPDFDNIIYIKDQNKILEAQIQFSDISFDEIFSFTEQQQIIDFFISQKEIFYLDQTDENIFLTKKPLNQPNSLAVFHQIELGSQNHQIIDFLDDKILLQETATNKIYLINSDLNNVLLQKDNISNYSFNQSEKKLLVFDDSEIFITDLNHYPFSWETITRLQGGITCADWYTESNYIFFVHDQQINIIEIDNRDKRNLITLPPMTTEWADVDYKGEKIYFTRNNEAGLFELEIAD